MHLGCILGCACSCVCGWICVLNLKSLFSLNKIGPIVRRFRRGLIPPLIHSHSSSNYSSNTRGGAIPPNDTNSVLTLQDTLTSFWVLSVQFLSIQVIEDIKFYQIQIIGIGNCEWIIMRRYSDFERLEGNISYWLTIPLKQKFPQKRYFSWIISLDENEIQERLLQLSVRISCDIISYSDSLLGMVSGSSCHLQTRCFTSRSSIIWIGSNTRIC